MKKILLLVIIICLIVVIFIFKFPLWIYVRGGNQVATWTCRGIELDLHICEHYKQDSGIVLMPYDPPCNYLCLGKTIYISENDALNGLDFYKAGGGFLNIYNQKK